MSDPSQGLQVGDVFQAPPAVSERPAVKRERNRFLGYVAGAVVLIALLGGGVVLLRSVAEEQKAKDAAFGRAEAAQTERLGDLARFDALQSKIIGLREISFVEKPEPVEPLEPGPTASAERKEEYARQLEQYKRDFAEYQRTLPAVQVRNNPDAWIGRKEAELRDHLRRIEPDPALLTASAKKSEWEKDEAAVLQRSITDYRNKLAPPSAPEQRREGIVK